MDTLKKIASFQIDHTRLTPGMYTSRVDGDVVTYDLRFVRPNTPPYLETAAMHTIEHLFATYVRSSEHSGGVVYFGPMGCRTGFYLLTVQLSREEVLALLKESIPAALAMDTVPGSTRKECGNYLEHDPEGAKKELAAYLTVLEAL